jgi:hypothetical protein
MVYAHSGNIMGGNKGETLLEASRETGLEVNSEETKFVFMSRHHNAEQNHNLLSVHNPLKT